MEINNNVEDSKHNKYSEKKKLWIQANKDKLAIYARNYYHKRCNEDPTYKKTLCEKEKSNKLKRCSKDKKAVGRPLKYIPIISVDPVDSVESVDKV